MAQKTSSNCSLFPVDSDDELSFHWARRCKNISSSRRRREKRKEKISPPVDMLLHSFQSKQESIDRRGKKSIFSLVFFFFVVWTRWQENLLLSSARRADFSLRSRWNFGRIHVENFDRQMIPFALDWFRLNRFVDNVRSAFVSALLLIRLLYQQ